MAKVRIQARAGDADASEDDCIPDGQNGKTKATRQTGALGLLLRVLRKEGFVGWYQVSITVLSPPNPA
jgi:adenine nucleotide transporter 17